MSSYFRNRLDQLIAGYNRTITRKTSLSHQSTGYMNGSGTRCYKRPHPVFWKYDLNERRILT